MRMDNVINSVSFGDTDIIFKKENESTISLANAREILKGDPSVYVGDTEPTDPAMKIWIDEGCPQQEYSTTYEQAVDNGYTKSKEQFFADLEGLEGAIDGVNNAANLVDSKLEDIGTAISNTNASALAAQNNLLWRRLTTNPASFYPVPQSPLYVRASGEPIQSGTGDPAPDNIRPILPWKAEGETVKVKRTGKNLLKLTDRTMVGYGYGDDATNKRIFTEGNYIKGLGQTNFSTQSNAALVSVSESHAEVTSSGGYGIGFPVRCKPNTKYTLSFATLPYEVRIVFYQEDGTYITNTGTYATTFKTYTTPANAVWQVILLRPDGTVRQTNIQLEYGEVVTPFEPYAGSEEITLTAPQDIYGGWMDNEGNGQVTWAKVVFTGAESVLL